MQCSGVPNAVCLLCRTLDYGMEACAEHVTGWEKWPGDIPMSNLLLAGLVCACARARSKGCTCVLTLCVPVRAGFPNLYVPPEEQDSPTATEGSSTDGQGKRRSRRLQMLQWATGIRW